MKTTIGSPWARLLRNIALPLLACGLLASCASLIGPRQVELPLARLQAGMDRRFPVHNRMLELFDIELSRPQLVLLPERDRIALTMTADVAPPFMRQSWHGNMALSGRLYIDPMRSAVLMADPHVDQFTIDGADPARQRQLTKVANLLMDKVVRDVPVYTFRLEDLRYAGVQFVPTRITTTPYALVVTLEPMR